MLDDSFAALWNRAHREDSRIVPTHEGDAALHVVVTFHGSVSRDGLFEAVRTHNRDLAYPLPRVLSSFRFLSLEGLALVIAAARRDLDRLSEEPPDPSRWAAVATRVNKSYFLDDHSLYVAAHTTAHLHPESFAPAD